MGRIMPRLAVLLLVICVATACLSFPSATRAEGPRPDPPTDASLHAYYSGNGLLNRGLYDLASAEYRKFLAAHADHDKAPLAHYGLGVSLFRLGKFDDAAEELAGLHAAGAFAYAAEVATMLGQCHLAGARYGEAAEAFNTVLQKHADHALADDAAAQLVEALYRDGKPEEAAAQCETFASRWSDSPHRDRADYFGGLADMARQAYAAAAERFKDLLKKHPGSPFAGHGTLLLAQCQHRENNLKAAARAYRQVIDRTDHPHRSDALLGLATLHRQEGRPKEAGPLLDQLLEMSAAGPLANSARLLRGRVWFDLGDYEAAAKAFRKVAKAKGPLVADATYWSAKCKLRRGDFSGAARDLKRAIAKYSDSALMPEMCYDRAIALTRGGDPKAAEEALADFRSRYPKHALAPDALYLLATTTHQQQAYKRSQGHVRTFQEHLRDHAMAAKIAFLFAENEYLAGNHKQAAAAYRLFLDKYGKDAQAHTARYRLGMALYHLGEYDEAQRLLSKLDAKHADAASFHPRHLALGDIYFQQAAWKQAENHLTAYLANGLDAPAADDALLKLGLALQRQQRHEEAIRQYDRLLERFAGNARGTDAEGRAGSSPRLFLQAMFERGQVLVVLQRDDEAAEAFEKVLAQDKDSRFATPARKHLATISLRRGDLTVAAERFASVARATKGTEDEAEALFQQGHALMTARDFKAARKPLKRLIDGFPSHARLPAAKANLAIACARQDRHDAALELIGQVNPSELDPALAASLQYEKAWCLRVLGKEGEATEAYRALLAAKADLRLVAHALLELADIEAGERRHEEAVKLLRRLREIVEQAEGDLPPSLKEQAAYRLGTCCFQVRQYNEAAGVLGAFVKAHADSKLLVSAHFFCGEALFELGKRGPAAKHFEQVVAGKTSDPAYGPALLRLGECQATQQRWAKSEEAFTEYLERFHDDAQWFQAEFGIGWARENQGRLPEAIEAYQRVVARHQGPTAARAQFQIGQCLFAQKHYEDAAGELLKVDILYAYPEWSAAALYEAGRCFEKLSKTAEARQQFEAVTKKHKDTQWAAMSSKRLAALGERSLPGR